jgi:hypothetical protein
MWYPSAQAAWPAPNGRSSMSTQNALAPTEPEAPKPLARDPWVFCFDPLSVLILAAGLVVSFIVWFIGQHLLDAWASTVAIAVIMVLTIFAAFARSIPFRAKEVAPVIIGLLVVTLIIVCTNGVSLNHREAPARAAAEQAQADNDARAAAHEALVRQVRQIFRDQHFTLAGDYYPEETDLTLNETGTSGTMEIGVHNSNGTTWTWLVINLVDGHWVAGCQGQNGQVYPWDNDLAWKVQIAGSCAQALTAPTPTPAPAPAP